MTPSWALSNGPGTLCIAQLGFLSGNISSGLMAGDDLGWYLQRGLDDSGAIHKMGPSLSLSQASLGPNSANPRWLGNNTEYDGSTNSSLIKGLLCAKH